jgi:hypothetical protein
LEGIGALFCNRRVLGIAFLRSFWPFAWGAPREMRSVVVSQRIEAARQLEGISCAAEGSESYNILQSSGLRRNGESQLICRSKLRFCRTRRCVCCDK